MILVSNGCSHTAGAEIEYSRQGNCYEKAWPKHLSDSLGYDHINLSMAGASTNRIVRTTYEFIYDYMQQGKSTKDLLFVIMWSGIYRTEIYVDTKRTYNYDCKWAHLIVGNDRYYKKEFPASLYYYFKSWTANMTGYQASCEFYIAVTNIQNLLHRYGIKYLFMDAANSGLLTTQLKLDPYRMHIDRRYYEGFDDRNNCYTTLCSENGQKIAQGSIDSGLNSHYDADAHIWWAKHVEKIIHKRNIL